MAHVPDGHDNPANGGGRRPESFWSSMGHGSAVAGSHEGGHLGGVTHRNDLRSFWGRSFRTAGDTSSDDSLSTSAGAFVICHRLSLRRASIVVALTTLMVIISSAVASGGTVPEWEVRILEFFNGWPDWLEPGMWALQQIGVLFAPVVVGLVIVAGTRNWRHLVPFVLVLPLKAGIEKGLVKQLIQRERPFVSVGPEIVVRGPAFEGLSFPSGHTTTAFAVGILAAAFLPPRWRVLPVAWAGAVAVIRMYYGEHNFLDVVAGAALGTAFATILWFFFLNRHVDPACGCPGS